MRWQPYNENNFLFDINKYFGGRLSGDTRNFATAISGRSDAVLN
ncbi:hypothetical protein LG52_1419 [Geobacillus kaustophilus]|uniref:Uncharacterized protein n=1 Tax=Geobacillus kaustophilus TaxID=1462 RepID=A0A0D8BQ57_GEOKU|nr:hypothetical protein LG52_1419 [Geobacillus kaustophilus]